MAMSPTSTAKYEAHPLADIFPMMGEDSAEFLGLVEDIKNQGLNRPIVIHDQKILDGRNRARACEIAGVSAKFIDFSKVEKKTDDPLAFVMSENLRRRHLNPGQQALALASQTSIMDGLAARAKAAHAEASSKGGSATQAELLENSKALAPAPKPSASGSTLSSRMFKRLPPSEPKSPSVQVHVEAAKLAGVAPKTMQAAMTIAKATTDKKIIAPLRKAVDNGRMSVEAAAQVARLPMAAQKTVMATFKPSADISKNEVRAAVGAVVREAETVKAGKELAALPEQEKLDIRVGDWREALKDIDKVDAVIVDPPYGSSTHDASTTRDDGSSAKGLTPAYSAWTAADVHAFVSDIAPRCKGWMVALTSHDLLLHWQEAYRAAGLYAFAPVPCVIRGMSVRMQGDGPSSWTIYSIAARPRTGKDRNGRDYSKWGTLPGAYVGTQSKPCAGWEDEGDLTNNVEAGGGRGKPIWLMGKLVRDYTRPGDLVCDPMAGWGSTLIASRLLGRRAVGADVDSKAVTEALARAHKLNVKG